MAKGILFWSGVLFVLFVPLLVGFVSKSANLAWLAAICGAFVTVMSRFDDLSELAMGPMQAKLRRAVEEAYATLDQVRELGVIIGRSTLTQLIAGEFMDGMSLAERLRIHDQVKAALQSLGVDQNGIGRAEEQWRKGITLIYFRAVRAAIEAGRSPSRPPTELQEVGKEFQKLLTFDEWKAPAPVEMEGFVEAHRVATDDVMMWIDDYRHFLLSGEIRRIDVFAEQ